MSEGGYGSHVQVLRMVLALARPASVLELGAGWYSTHAFVRDPNVKRLRSVETDPDWKRRLKAAGLAQGTDVRWTVRVVGDVARSLPADLRRSYDLVFVDNGTCCEERVAAITAVLERPHPVVVVHDAEQESYGRVIQRMAGIGNVVIFAPKATPHTAIIWPR